jgi:hypothetical protein
MECYQAYKDGRAGKNPAEGCHEGEIAFYDYYIIPLANNLKDYGEFGASSVEYLNYAIHYRQEREARGREIVTETLESVCQRRSPSVEKQSLAPSKKSNGSQRSVQFGIGRRKD